MITNGLIKFRKKIKESQISYAKCRFLFVVAGRILGPITEYNRLIVKASLEDTIIPFPKGSYNWEKTEVETRTLIRFQNTISCCFLSSGV